MPVQKSLETYCSFEKYMNPIIFVQAMGKVVGQTDLFDLGIAPALWERKIWV